MWIYYEWFLSERWSSTLYHTISTFNNLEKVAFWKHCGKRRKCWKPVFSPFPTMFSAFPRTNFNFCSHIENVRKFAKWVENTVGKGEIARYEQFLLFPQCFQKACFPGASKGVIVWEWVKGVIAWSTWPIKIPKLLQHWYHTFSHKDRVSFCMWTQNFILFMQCNMVKFIYTSTERYNLYLSLLNIKKI